MKLLLDTHAVLWWFSGDAALTPAARAAIGAAEAEIYVSAVSGIEISTKVRIGKLPQAGTLVERFEAMVAHEGFVPLPITLAHGLLAGHLSIDHKDPFDRLLIAQSLIDGLALVSNERLFDQAGVSRIW